MAAHSGDGAAVRQSGAERTERLQCSSHAEPGPAERRAAKWAAQHLQGAVPSQHCEHALTHHPRHVATFMHEEQPQFYGIGPAAEYLLRVSQWTPRLLMESKNQLLLVLL